MIDKTNLMIGDIVYFKSSWGELFVRVEEMLEKGINPNWSYGEVTATYSYEDLYPVHITPELLEHLGFEKVKQEDCYHPFHWQIEKYKDDDKSIISNFIYRVSLYKTPSENYELFIANTGSEHRNITFSKEINTLHELQQALRMCEIDFEGEAPASCQTLKTCVQPWVGAFRPPLST